MSLIILPRKLLDNFFWGGGWVPFFFFLKLKLKLTYLLVGNFHFARRIHQNFDFFSLAQFFRFEPLGGSITLALFLHDREETRVGAGAVRLVGWLVEKEKEKGQIFKEKG